MKRHTSTTPRKANMIFIICLILAVILFSTIASAQDRYSVQITTDNVIFQKGIFYGGVEFNAEFNNHIYVRPQIHYAYLTDGYLEIASGIGYNIAYNRWNYKSGIKLGVINRAATYPIFGVEGAIEYHFTEKFGIGLRGSYDARGDAVFYDGNKWVYNSQVYLKFVL
jgi:hypothetical protein